MLANGQGNLGSIPGRVIPKTQKMVFDTFLLNIQRYRIGIKSKMDQSKERISASPSPQFSSCWKGSLCVTLNFGRLIYIYIFFVRHNILNELRIYIYIYIYKGANPNVISHTQIFHLSHTSHFWMGLSCPVNWINFCSCRRSGSTFPQ